MSSEFNSIYSVCSCVDGHVDADDDKGDDDDDGVEIKPLLAGDWYGNKIN